MKLKKIFALSLLSLGMLGATSASASQINFSYQASDFSGETGQMALSGFNEAANFWMNRLTDDVTISLDIGFQSFGNQIIGQTNSNTAVFLYSDFATALSGDATSAYDDIAIGSLACEDQGAGNCARSFLETEAGSDVLDNDGTPDNFGMSITQANAKALGLSVDSWGNSFNDSDGSVNFSSDFAFDFDSSDGIESGKMDFVGVAIHEIGHALGFMSGVDTYDFHSNSGEAGTGADLDYYAVFNSLDLFRYSEESYALGEGVLDFRPGVPAYFSLDGGTTSLATMSQGHYIGDGHGHQASHWEDDLGLGIMDPTFAHGETGASTSLDLVAMDAIGWNVDYSYTDLVVDPVEPGEPSASVPLPASVFLLSTALFGMRLRRKNNS
jgi:hypothetical protein